MWWGIWLVACSYGISGIATVFSAIVTTVVVRFLTGVAFLEHTQRRKVEFRVYMAETNAFVPMWYRKVTEQERQVIVEEFDKEQAAYLEKKRL